MKRELKETSNDYMQQLRMIDAIQRLGIEYHFEVEIDQALQNIFQKFHDYCKDNDDLYITALGFLLLRQHGYRVSCELKEEMKRELKETSNDYMQQLRMIDAIQRLGIEYHFEVEIDQTLQNIFQKFHDYCKDNDDLYIIALGFRLLRQHGYRVSCEIFEKYKDGKGEFKLVSNVVGVLEFHEATYLRVRGEDVLDHGFVFTKKGLPRVEARYYISIYEQLASHHQALLRLAKLDFNLLQSLHKRELSEMCRWSFSCLDQLPEYMKIFYKALLEFFEEIEEEIVEQGTSYGVNYGKEAVKNMCRAYCDEARWRELKYKPKTEEYMQLAMKSCGYTSLIIISFLGMADIPTKEAFDWVLSQPAMVTATLTICRLTDDIDGHEVIN
ncbi:hypothetical protein BUALT_Bualt03G0010500 [Buddleja alternifolia]|uniref:Terpene synthase n=1 Tax=Buddleja alternifolia TaxID=168488 RepID=A0AAV6XWX5_9LAMI|nr:hypothetical protein BUALT_Bualt03G0010500 [Buddleja alternifolia]